MLSVPCCMDRQMEGQICVVWCRFKKEEERNVDGSNLDHWPRCAEAHDARTRAMWTLLAACRKSDKLGVMGLHRSPSACLHMPVAPAAFADLSSPRQDWQVI